MACLTDVEKIYSLMRACAANLISKGIYQWNECYPTKEILTDDVKLQQLYVLESNQNIIGCVVVSFVMDDEYKSVSWLTPTTKHIYIHRLAVHPKHQGKGYAQKLMQFAENVAKSNSCASIRLDTFSKNLRNQKFYELRGYKKVGEVFFPKQSEHPFYCYELVL